MGWAAEPRRLQAVWQRVPVFHQKSRLAGLFRVARCVPTQEKRCLGYRVDWREIHWLRKCGSGCDLGPGRLDKAKTFGAKMGSGATRRRQALRFCKTHLPLTEFQANKFTEDSIKLSTNALSAIQPSGQKLPSIYGWACLLFLGSN